MFQTISGFRSARWSRSSLAMPAAKPAARRTVNTSSAVERSGDASSTATPAPASRLAAARQMAATSGSTGVMPPRSGLNATRRSAAGRSTDSA